MFDFSWSEIAIIVIVALVFIRPADLPVALRGLSRGVRAVRRMAAEFQGHVDEMVREADMGEVREQFRDLRRFDLRTKVERAIDADGTLRRSFEPPPSLSLAPPLAPAPVLPAPEPEPVEAPAILPPSTARRLARERERWYPPSILPPVMVQHGSRRVRLGAPEGEEKE